MLNRELLKTLIFSILTVGFAASLQSRFNLFFPIYPPLWCAVPHWGTDFRHGGHMGTISTRNRTDGSIAHRAEVVTRHNGKRVKFTATFDRPAAAAAWIKRKEKEVRAPGYTPPNAQNGATLGDAIRRYVEDNPAIGRTKQQVLRSIGDASIADQQCATLTSADLVDFARDLGRDKQPQTVQNYLSHLGAILRVARSAYRIQVGRDVMPDAMDACKRLGLTSKGRKRERRPTIGEINLIMEHFTDRERRKGMMPMTAIVAFALFSSRRQDEITRITRADFEPATPDHAARVLVRDMKNPGEKIGNHVWCEIPDQAARVALAQPPGDLFFPYNPRSISANFTRATSLLGIDDLHFYDLRHEATTRLFEMGRTIPMVASVTGHRSWASLQRYSHIRSTGDRWADWEWLDRIAPPD